MSSGCIQNMSEDIFIKQNELPQIISELEPTPLDSLLKIDSCQPNFLIREDDEELTLEHFLADLDYLMWVLENNFPFFYTAYWARNVDINQLAYGARQAILSTDEIDEEIFFEIMWYYFESLHNIGHFGFLNHIQYHILRMQLEEAPYDRLGLFELLDSPRVQGFYSSRVTESASIMVTKRESNTPDTTITIIEDEPIAIITIPSFMGSHEDAVNKITKLYAEIDRFDHLIIDIRGNRGGWPFLFTETIMGLLVDGVPREEWFVFFMDGEYITRLTSVVLASGIFPGYVLPRNIFGSIDEIISNNYLPQLVEEDIDRFSYAFLAGVPVGMPGDAQFTFNGEIWLLVDENNFSGAQITAWITKETGFATLVGDITGGAWGGLRLYSAMPNTGILFQFDAFYITDQFGRPLEAGTIPHYFNKSGMDALETTFALIAGGYR